MSTIEVTIAEQVAEVDLLGAQGPRGFASGPLGVGSVDAETISDDDSEQALIREKLGLVETEPLARFGLDIEDGTASTILVYGDSTYWGATPENTAVQNPDNPPKAMQDFLWLYYGNFAATVTNRAVSGTTIANALAGTNGYSQTYAADLASAGASTVVIAYGLNDATGSSKLTPEAFRECLVEAVVVARRAGVVPVLVTAIPNFSGPTGVTFTGVQRAEEVKFYQDIVRSVAAGYGVKLVDQGAMVAKMLASGKYKATDLLPDGTHGATILQKQMGFNIAGELIGGGLEGFTRGGQVQPGILPNVRVTNQAVAASTSSQFGFVVSGTGASAEDVRVIFRVDETGLDVYMAHAIKGTLAGPFSLGLDGTQLFAAYSQAGDFIPDSDYIHDYEVLIAENVDPGWHILYWPTTSGKTSTFQYLKSRATSVPMSGQLGDGSYFDGRRGPVSRLVNDAAGASTPIVFRDWPFSRLSRDRTFEFEGQLADGDAVIISGASHGADDGAASAFAGLMIGLSADGFMSVREASGPSSWTEYVLGGTDLSLASHRYTVQITPALQIIISIDGVYVGSNFTGSQPFWGGCFGLFKAAAGGVLAVDLCEVL